MTPPTAHILQVLTGAVAPLGEAGATSAIAKQPVAHPVAIGPLGLAGDAQADLRVHGGHDKAVHLYAWEHYAQWQRELGNLPLLQAPGAFGENLALTGLDEAGVCLGDHWRAGWYCRTLQGGVVQAGDRLKLLERPHPGWTVQRLLALIRDRECDPAALSGVLELPLPPSWRKLFARRLEQGLAENWEARLQGAQPER